MMKRLFFIILVIGIAFNVSAGIKVSRLKTDDGISCESTSFIKCYSMWNDIGHNKFEVSLSRYFSDEFCDTTYVISFKHEYSYTFPVEAGDTMVLKSLNNDGHIFLTCDSITPSGKVLDFGTQSGGIMSPGVININIPRGVKRQYVWHYTISKELLNKLLTMGIIGIDVALNKDCADIEIGKNRMVKALVKAVAKLNGHP